MSLGGRGIRPACMAEFESADDLLAAVKRLASSGYRRIDAFTPFEVPGLDEALRLKRSAIPLIVLLVGLAGALAGYAIQWYANAVDYALNVGGKPPHSAPAFVPATFDSVILSAAFAVVIALLFFTRMPRLWDPVFEVEGFERASIDRFWVAIDVSDPRLDAERTPSDLEELQPLRIVWLEETQ